MDTFRKKPMPEKRHQIAPIKAKDITTGRKFLRYTLVTNAYDGGAAGGGGLLSILLAVNW